MSNNGGDSFDNEPEKVAKSLAAVSLSAEFAPRDRNAALNQRPEENIHLSVDEAGNPCIEVIVDEKKFKLYEVTYAYHVTRLGEGTPEADWYEILKTTIANDKKYDAGLLGLRCVFFTTTLYRDGLPTSSPYPSDGKGKKYMRVKVPLSMFNNYHISRPKEMKPSQVRLILTPDVTTTASIRNAGGDCFTTVNKTYNEWLMFHKEAWYSNKYNKSSDKRFVNFVVLHEVSLDERAKWDVVKRSDSGAGGEVPKLLEKPDDPLLVWSIWRENGQLQDENKQLRNENEQLRKLLRQICENLPKR